jgi:transcription termination factor Rho
MAARTACNVLKEEKLEFMAEDLTKDVDSATPRRTRRTRAKSEDSTPTPPMPDTAASEAATAPTRRRRSRQTDTVTASESESPKPRGRRRKADLNDNQPVTIVDVASPMPYPESSHDQSPPPSPAGEDARPKRTRRPRRAAEAGAESAKPLSETVETGTVESPEPSPSEVTPKTRRPRRRRGESSEQAEVGDAAEPVSASKTNAPLEVVTVSDAEEPREQRPEEARETPVAPPANVAEDEAGDGKPEAVAMGDVASPLPKRDEGPNGREEAMLTAPSEPRDPRTEEAPVPAPAVTAARESVVPLPARLPVPRVEDVADANGPSVAPVTGPQPVPPSRGRDHRRSDYAPHRNGANANNRRDLPRQREAPLTMAQLEAMTLLELYKLARQLNVDNFRQYKKGELIWEILRARTHKDGFVFVQGLLDIVGDYGFLRPTDFQRSREDVYVSASQIRRFDLRAGDQVSGQARPPKEGERYFALLRVEAVNGLSPEKSAERPDFEGLTPIFPNSRFRLETSREDLACRLVDIIAPIGRGQRGLIVAPPKAGKTMLLKKLANAIAQNSPETHLMVLLIDERPEEVTDMQRSVRAEVASSTFDEPPEDHIRVAEMVLERAKRLVEMGRDVVILLDSITRLARAYNLTIPPSGRTLSGGMDPAALHKPKRFLGRRVKLRMAVV